MKYSIPFIVSSISLVTASPIFDRASQDVAPLISANIAEHEIPDSYIVVFKDHVKESAATKHHSWVQELHTTSLKKRSQIPLMKSGSEWLNDAADGLKHTYNISGELLGYAGTFDKSVLEEIRRHPDVAFVEKDSKVFAFKEPEPVVENSAPWGLARISHRDALGFGTFNKYVHQASGGEGVDAYVVDTGTNYNHIDFEGRAAWGKTIPLGDVDQDGNGHGTHCSGTIAGKKYGVAKKAHIIAVKVLRSNGSGTMSDVVKGVEWAATEHKKTVAKKNKNFKGSVANMSLGGGKSRTLNLSVNYAVRAGLHFAVAAGNDNADACEYSPAGADEAVTVGASTLADERAYFSNYGKCVDIFAPGLNIQSTWIGSEYAVKTISGTSMASPHVAGLLAYFLSLQPDPDSEYAVEPLTPKELKRNLIAIASPDKLSGIPEETCNLLAWNGGGAANLSEIWKDTLPSKGEKKSIKASSGALIEELEVIVEGEVKAIFDKAKAALSEL
ncbi:serine protease [Terfezia boudieri ATCC MYA-4762]|uniref:Serine protease n=1 Tax=Terfezia boudieri ATCC MYA-4762 TaxID=1051890 RepID=A0A3N4M216_9PEZI|nr:serine protease [Terfezia boudieri ATCC MYA-4762]